MTALHRLGRYRVLAQIGAGGMGRVFHARSYGAEGVTKDVCLKCIRPERLADRGLRESFIREARISARLTHPHIVPVFDFGRSEEHYYLAMEWVDGVDLRSLLAHGGPLPAYVLARVAADVAKALAYAHESAPDAPIVHRDVKPANVLVSRSGDVRLADFGVASLAHESAGVAGTPHYMAPEQREGHATTKSDLFALGTLLDRALPEGRAGAELAELVDRLLASRAADRPSASAAVEALERLVVLERPEGAPSPTEVLAECVQRVSSALPELPLEDVDLEGTASWMLEPSRATADAAVAARPRRRRVFAALALVAVVALGAGIGSVVFSATAPPAAANRAPAAAAARLDEPTLASAPAPGAPIGSTLDAVRSEAAEPAEVSSPRAHPRARAAAVSRARVRHRRPTAAEEPEEPEEPEEQPTREQAIVPPASISVNAIPWATVEIDGAARGTTPLIALRLEPGRHRVVMRNAVLGAEVTRSVEVEAGSTTKLIVDLRADP